MNFELRLKLQRVARRIRSLRLWTALACCWLLWAAVGIVLFELAGRGGWNVRLTWDQLVVLAAVTSAACVLAAIVTARNQLAVARRVEARHPELGTLLLAAVEGAEIPRERLGYLQADVIRRAVEHSRAHSWNEAIPPWRLGLARLASFAALGLLAGVCIGLARQAGAHGGIGSSHATGDAFAAGEFEIEVDPGNAEIERGTSLVVVADFPAAVPNGATLVVAGNAVGKLAQEMVRSLEDPKFVGRVPSVEEDLSYHVEFAGRRSDTYRITVFDYPELVRADAQLDYPSYTSLPKTTIADVRHITAVEGTQLTLLCRLNKEVATAKLADNDGSDIKLERDDEDVTLYRADWTLTKSRRFKLQLVDGDGRKNRLPAEIIVNVTPNQPAKIVIDRPARDVDVSPLEELQVKAAATDDFGLVRTGLSYSLGGGEEQEIEMAGEAAAAPVKERSLAHLLDFESFEAEPDQLVSYFFWAEDVGPDGEPRRTASDMYFAEARPFEEVYRQGEQPTEGAQQQQQQGQQGGNAQEAAELAQLQKEIINATWKLVRRETSRAPSDGNPSDEFPADSRLVQESQESAIERLSALAERLEDAESLAHVENAKAQMDKALEQLSAAAEKSDPALLRPALSTEQAAYQALLKLRAREHDVVRGQNQQGSGAQRGGSASQRQLNQLELRADENRYETQSRATNPQETQAQRESREILNRLRDLARRQEDLNERLRELQSALQQAQTEQEREQLRRELKRLRDQQQEILRDSDELISQMDQSQSRSASPDARQRMEETRSRVQQASEALEQGQLPEAVTEGTRAGRQLSELRDEFRQQAANRFSEEMTEMRRSARELDEQQQQFSEQLNEQGRLQTGRSLRDTGERAEMQRGLGQQREELEELLERMQQTIQEAEQPEPLLSRQLYDTFREARQQRVEDALDVARQLVEIGVERQAGEAMRVADRGINRLRQGVEQAAESVLGDEAEALRRAQREVERLAEELNREIDGARRNNEDENVDRNGNAAQSRGAGRPPGESPSPSQDERRQGDAQPQREGEAGHQDESARDGQNGEEQDQPGQGGGRGSQPSDPPASDAQQGGGGDRQRSSLRGGNGGGERDRQRNGEGGRQVDLGELFNGGDRENRGGRGGGGPGGPITGEDFRQWADRLRDVEQILDDAELRAEAARIRDRAQDVRLDFRRYSKEPDWTKLQDLVAEPLVELSRRIDQEIRRLESPDALVPIDRDPVPPEFVEQVRRYYERLGSGE